MQSGGVPVQLFAFYMCRDGDDDFPLWTEYSDMFRVGSRCS